MSWQKVNTVYYIVLVVMGLLWLAQLHTFGIVVGLAAIAVAYFAYQRKRLSYFCAAALYFGLLRTAMDDGHDFHQGFQSYAKLFYFICVVLAFFLHEKVAIKNKKEDAEGTIPD